MRYQDPAPAVPIPRVVPAYPSIAYTRFLRLPRALDDGVLRPAESEILLEAADARLLGDGERDERLAEAEVVFNVLRDQGRSTSRRSSGCAARWARILHHSVHRAA